MRHLKRTAKLGRTGTHRNRMLANLVCSLIKHRRVTTTLAKAKAARSVAEKMITLGKSGTLHAPPPGRRPPAPGRGGRQNPLQRNRPDPKRAPRRLHPHRPPRQPHGKYRAPPGRRRRNGHPGICGCPRPAGTRARGQGPRRRQKIRAGRQARRTQKRKRSRRRPRIGRSVAAKWPRRPAAAFQEAGTLRLPLRKRLARHSPARRGSLPISWRQSRRDGINSAQLCGFPRCALWGPLIFGSDFPAPPSTGILPAVKKSVSD